MEDLAELRQRHRLTQLVEAESEAVHHVEVGEPEPIELARGVGEGLAVVGRTHVVEHAVGREPHADAVRRKHLDDSFDDLAQEPEAVRGAATVLVISMVGAGLEELVEQVPVRGVDLDAVETRFARAPRRGDVVGDDAGQLLGLERARRLVLLLALGGVHAVPLEADRRGRDGQLPAVEVRV